MISELNGNSSEQQNLDVNSMYEHNGRLTYNDFANRSIKTLENNLEIQNKLFKPIRDTLAKFLDCRNAQAFYKFERELEESEREHLNLLSRLKKNDFEVIFVGAEKAGKSSLINSYLNCPDMLPTGIGRCTYTEIEILPSEKVDEELIVIEYFNQNEFEEIIKINQSLLEECDPEKESHLIALKAEKRELESCRNDENFCELLRKVKEEKKFKKSDLEEAKKLLNDQVADVKNSRALKSIKIYTSRFLMKNVLIYDLPGFDSPTKIHKDLAIKRCKSADAIVYVKDSLRPSLPLHEIEMLDTFKNIDLLIPFEEKLILALTNIDRINNLNDYHLTLQTTEKEWKKYKLSKDRIAKVSNEFLSNEIKLRNFGMNDNGIEKLEQLINSFKYESRLKTLKKIVFTAIINFEQRMRDFIKLAEQDLLDGVDLNEYPEKTKESKYFETQQEKAKAKWWNTEWKNIHEKFSAFFLKLVGTPENFTKNNHFYSFKIRYQEIVDLMISEIKSQHLKRFINIYKDQLEAGGSIAPGEVHSEIRKELTQIVYDNLSKILSTELGQKVWETISIMLNWVLQETFCIKEIKGELLQDTEKNTQQIIIKQIETLILRIARPAVDLFLRFPRHDGRISCMKRYVHEILILDMFYYNENNSKFEPKGLESYLLTGKFKIDEEQHTSSLSLDIDKIKEKVIFDNKDVFAITQNFEEARKQIEDDLDTFREYMKYSVYYGSGLEAYFHSELEKLKKRFFKYEKNDDSWRIRVFKEIENGNPNIPFTQLKLQAKEKYEIVKSLKEIKNRLNQR